MPKTQYASPVRRHRAAAVTYLGLLGPVYFIPPMFRRLLPGHPLLVVALAVACIVVLMQYGIMPVLHRVFARWLRPTMSER